MVNDCVPADCDPLGKEDDRLPDMFHEEPLAPYHEAVPYPDKDLHGLFRRFLEEKK